jgi:hypothetical protein
MSTNVPPVDSAMDSTIDPTALSLNRAVSPFTGLTGVDAVTTSAASNTLGPSTDVIPSVDLSSVNWNDYLDLTPGMDPGTLFAFDDLFPQDPSVTSASSDSPPLFANSGFLGSGCFLEM